MFPDADNPPIGRTQSPVHLAVTGLVASNFGVPKFPVGLRASIAAWATVPEAAVHEERQPVPPKEKIRFAENILIPPPAGDSILAKQFYQGEFGVLIALPANTGHDL